MKGILFFKKKIHKLTPNTYSHFSYLTKIILGFV